MRKFNFLKIKHLRQNDKQPNANFLFDTNFLNAKIVGLFYPGNQNRQWLFGIYDTKKCFNRFYIGPKRHGNLMMKSIILKKSAPCNFRKKKYFYAK